MSNRDPYSDSLFELVVSLQVFHSGCFPESSLARRLMFPV
jgi:hypothetical protein